jgi:hypothetical protein
MRSSMRPLTGTVLTAAWLLCVPIAGAVAQSSPPSPSKTPSAGVSTPSSSISDKDLDAAAAAIQHVASLQENYQQRLSTAAPADKKRIVDEANTAIMKAVTDQGLTVEKYNSIMETAQKDPAVHDKILQRLRPATK